MDSVTLIRRKVLGKQSAVNLLDPESLKVSQFNLIASKHKYLRRKVVDVEMVCCLPSSTSGQESVWCEEPQAGLAGATTRMLRSHPPG